MSQCALIVQRSRKEIRKGYTFSQYYLQVLFWQTGSCELSRTVDGGAVGDGEDGEVIKTVFPSDISIILYQCERLARGLPSLQGCARGLPSFQGCDRVLPSFQGCDRALPSFQGCDRGLPSFRGSDRDDRSQKITIPSFLGSPITPITPITPILLIPTPRYRGRITCGEAVTRLETWANHSAGL